MIIRISIQAPYLCDHRGELQVDFTNHFCPGHKGEEAGWFGTNTNSSEESY